MSPWRVFTSDPVAYRMQLLVGRACTNIYTRVYVHRLVDGAATRKVDHGAFSDSLLFPIGPPMRFSTERSGVIRSF